MSQLDSIGLVETSSVAAGFQIEDAILKAASVQLLLARTICSGKYLIVFAGDVASVQAGIEAARQINEHFLIEARVISRVHPAVFPAITGTVNLDREKAGALGVIDFFKTHSRARLHADTSDVPPPGNARLPGGLLGIPFGCGFASPRYSWRA